MIRLIGLGNALTDVHMSIESDNLLEELELPKGSMQLIDAYRFEKINERMYGYSKSISCGGSAANTVTGASKLGVPCTFIGKVHADQIGELYKKDLESYQVNPCLLSDSEACGQALAFVSPDGERTFATFLGAAANLKPEDLYPELFQGHDLLYLEGYLVQNQDLVRKAVRLAKDQGLKVALDLASYNVVEANLQFLTQFLEEDVDLVFANEEEAKAFTGLEPEGALNAMAAICDTAVVKIGARGALAKQGNLSVSVPATVANRLDTTGAGDLFAAGFIYGMHLGLPLEESVRYGTITAGKVIEVIGPKMQPEAWSEILATF